VDTGSSIPTGAWVVQAYLVDQQGRTLSHAPRPATGTKTAAFATEGNKMLGMAVIALHAQEAMFQSYAFR